MSPLAEQLFVYMADGKIHRGEILAAHFEMTRQGIWKAINELKALGLVTSVGRQGYQTRYAYTVLSEEAINRYLRPTLRHQLDTLMVLYSADSTNDVAAALDVDNAAVVVSEMQLKGKGRLDRVWQSPLAANLYFSMKLCFRKQTLANLTSFSPAFALYVARMLNELSIPARVKWPNDLWANGAKLGGILIEIKASSEYYAEMTVGIGINNHRIDRSELASYTTDCESVIGWPLDRNLLTARLIEILLNLHEVYEENQGIDLAPLWQTYSALIHQKVRLFSPHQEIIGTEVGIAENGALMICDEEGKISNYFFGELSLRPYV